MIIRDRFLNERIISLFCYYLCFLELKIWNLFNEKVSYLKVKYFFVIVIFGFFNILRFG